VCRSHSLEYINPAATDQPFHYGTALNVVDGRNDHDQSCLAELPLVLLAAIETAAIQLDAAMSQLGQKRSCGDVGSNVRFARKRKWRDDL
jgi:hypothetical protein